MDPDEFDLGISPFVQAPDDDIVEKFGGQELDRQNPVSVAWHFVVALTAEPQDADAIEALVNPSTLDAWDPWPDMREMVRGFGLSDRVDRSEVRDDVAFMRLYEVSGDTPVQTMGIGVAYTHHLALVRGSDGAWWIHATGQSRDDFDEATRNG